MIILTATLLPGCRDAKDTGSSSKPPSPHDTQVKGSDKVVPESLTQTPSKVDRLFERGPGEDPAPYAFPDLSWEDIPQLMQRVGNTDVSRYRPVNKDSSITQFDPVPEGIVAAWLIEGILIGGNYPSLISRAMLGEEGSDNHSINDVAKVSAIYRAWWEKSKGTSLQQARAISPKNRGEVRWR
jgi:hypothetical protein